MKSINYDNIIKKDAIDNFRVMPNDLKVVFQKDMHALRIVINFIKEMK